MARFWRLAALLMGSVLWAPLAVHDSFPQSPDDDIIALWLFDETQYPHATLTDAGRYGFDLRLLDAGRLEAGKFGKALRIPSGPEPGVYYAEWSGNVVGRRMRRRDGTPSGLWGPTLAPERLLSTLAGLDWTWEFWLKLPGAPSRDVVILDMGDSYRPGFTLILGTGAREFRVVHAYAGFEAVCPTAEDALRDGRWHHVAFTWNAAERKLEHYLDGRVHPVRGVAAIAVESVPKLEVPASLATTDFGVFDSSGDYEKSRQHRFNLSLGKARNGGSDGEIWIDELRFSRAVQYRESFPSPGSFARHSSAVPAGPTVPAGPRLLFSADAVAGPLQIGSRKHVFIDEAILEEKQNLRLTVNPPTQFQPVNQKFHGSISVFEKDGKICVLDPDGYGSPEGIVRFWCSGDGLNFEAPELGLVEYQGSTRNNILMIRTPMTGEAFVDRNPNVSSKEKYKLTAWVSNRGIYLYLSPDGVHWRRNESCMLPLASGGSAETYWDDQRERYVMFIKRDGSYNTPEFPGRGRRACIFETDDAARPWPFHALDKPYFEAWAIPAVTGEGPVALGLTALGEVYRTRALKYPWAPDTYLAFIWRFDRQAIRQTELGISRNGVRWNTYGDRGMYLPNGWKFGDLNVVETLAVGGLVRRENEVWQYYMLFSGAHGAGERAVIRTTQRIDGFTSLDAGPEVGTLVTKPLIFEGDTLALNIKARGSARVALLSAAGVPLPGFSTADCIPVQGDSVHRTVTWKGGASVRAHAGKAVKLKFELQDAKLFAFQVLTQGPSPRGLGKK